MQFLATPELERWSVQPKPLARVINNYTKGKCYDETEKM